MRGLFCVRWALGHGRKAKLIRADTTGKGRGKRQCLDATIDRMVVPALATRTPGSRSIGSVCSILGYLRRYSWIQCLDGVNRGHKQQNENERLLVTIRSPAEIGLQSPFFLPNACCYHSLGLKRNAVRSPNKSKGSQNTVQFMSC